MQFVRVFVFHFGFATVLKAKGLTSLLIPVGLAAYNFYKQATLPNFALPAGAAWMSAAVMPLFFYSAYLGGKLVYEYGVGVQRQGQGPEIAKMQKEQ